ncbi:type II toxin-antitoxin system death-on-curing family toxin [Desulfuribacillus alkaliarsenatis]|uniref:Death-on-curing family protein n=1 Tax=Desulfuribacillus alkaliarsenatis TaxID=766136 RepID=A0A1E5G1R5_9FIRM|nr:type II toxin-antitoxin system death-on-curing family toxin [Desulfuribacillus alkaliarsenatis]OEF96850.1 death-on-curing family protein [Desulfuribacillus alkaliarsenatis]
MRYLSEQEVIAINYFLIERYSSGEQKGVKQTVFGADAYVDVFEKGAALFESIAKNHCFQNANKRTAFVVLLQFLSYNGYYFKMDQQAAENFVVDVVNHKYDFKEIVNVIKENSRVK